MKDLYKKIISLNNLAPSHKVNLLFEGLVNKALNSRSITELNASERNLLQLKCAQAEYELERYWANLVISSKKPKEKIFKFPYFSNYEKLTKMEWLTFLSCTKHEKHNILFVGGGPLPLTAIILASKYRAKVSILDSDKEACTLSKNLIDLLDLNEKIKIINADGKDYSDYKKYNVIFVAALAGVNKKSKEEILRKIKKDSLKGTHVLARSSWGTREILYKPLDKKLFKIFKPIVEVRPHNDVVNSVVIFENK